MSKEEIKQAASQLFAATAHNVLWANPKGEFFTSENIGSLSLKAGQILTKYERTTEKKVNEASTTDEKVLNANDSIAFIKSATSLEVIKQFESDERKSVKSVYDWKAKQLIEAIDVVGATGANYTNNTDTKK